MRHFFPRRPPLPAPRAVTTLALGMAMPAAPRSLVTRTGRAQARAPRRPRAVRPAIELTAVAARAHPHLHAAAATHEQPGIVHLASREVDWTIRQNPAILWLDPPANADLRRNPGPDWQVFRSGVASTSSPHLFIPNPTRQSRPWRSAPRLNPARSSSRQPGEIRAPSTPAMHQPPRSRVPTREQPGRACSPEKRAFSQPPTFPRPPARTSGRPDDPPGRFTRRGREGMRMRRICHRPQMGWGTGEAVLGPLFPEPSPVAG